jgi:hypothetical protein
MAKTTCPVSREQFVAKAQPVDVTINNVSFKAVPKEFSTGSLGWNINDKATLYVDGVPVQVQIGLNLTIIGSKELPKEGG